MAIARDNTPERLVSASRAEEEQGFELKLRPRWLGEFHRPVEAWLSKKKMQRTKVGRRTMIREFELEKVIVDGGQSPAPSWRVQ